MTILEPFVAANVLTWTEMKWFFLNSMKMTPSTYVALIWTKINWSEHLIRTLSVIPVLTIFCFSDNYAPNLSTTSTSPVEGTNATLSCAAVTSAGEDLDGYNWYKNNVQISGATAATYVLPNKNRADDGKYSCAVTTKDLGPSQRSNNITIAFKCELVFHLLRRNVAGNLGNSNYFFFKWCQFWKQLLQQTC